MQDKISMGMNRTGLKASPLVADELLELMEMQDDVPAPAIDADALRRAYRDEAEPVGSVPPPASLKGVFGAAKEALSGHRMHVLLDKLGERAAYERAGVRLYDAMLRKVDGADDLPPGLSVAALREIRDDEASHFGLLVDAIERLGGDPTTQTPCADVAAVQGMGLMQAMNDPRTTTPQALQTLLAAELIDVASWELLVSLADGFGQDELANRFNLAHARELEHEEKVRGWLAATLNERALGNAQPR
jgi:ferritin-like protein